MTNRLGTEFCYDGVAAVRAHANNGQILASSDQLGWPGVRLDVYTYCGCDFDNFVFDGHYVGIQLNNDALTVGIRDHDGWSQIVMPPGSLWIHPKGAPLSARHGNFAHCAGAVVDDGFLDSVMGQHCEVNGGYVVEDPILSHLLSALIDQVRNRDPGIVHNLPLSKSLIHSFALSLGSGHAVPAPRLKSGGIAPHQIQALRAWLIENIGSPLRVEEMADLVGLSVSHFAREFKRSTGNSPWNYVLQLRLELAKSLLDEGEPIKMAAFRCGFVDQAHFSRAFRTHFGAPPRRSVANTRG